MILYHWSPKARRGSINRRGLVPGSLSASVPRWRPPYICFSHSPSLAWSLSGNLHTEPGEWDLWMTHTERLEGYEIIPFDNGDPKEYRVYHRVYKRDIWYVGTRTV